MSYHVQSLPEYVRLQHTPDPIYVRTGLKWPTYLDMDTSTFCNLMLRMLKAVRDGPMERGEDDEDDDE
ncbi:hypothetical protein LguiB_027227 [Lonicera macranthoides]